MVFEHSQKVVLDAGKASDPVPVLSGDPQGSVLEPVLFLVFINDLRENIRSSVRLFSNDCVLLAFPLANFSMAWCHALFL